MNWAGLRLVSPENQDVIYDFNYTHEFGSENGKEINAYGYFLKAGYRFSSVQTQPVLSLRYTFASGGRKDDDVIRTFDPAYGAGDKFYGWMNIVQWSNLSDPEIVLELLWQDLLKHTTDIHSARYSLSRQRKSLH
jgi:hypothetical protein